MPRYIIKLEDYYLEWSTVVDAPVTFGATWAARGWRWGKEQAA